MKEATLVFLQRNDRILLGFKKRGFGEGKWNGFGGKVEPGETVAAAAERECCEEAGIRLTDYHKVCTLAVKDVDMLVHVFIADNFEGDPTESEEMRPRWFKREALPYHAMWPTDRTWLPAVLSGEPALCGTIDI